MPLSGGTTGAHDDAAHQGSAKRDVVDGVAGLGPAGNVLAVGPDLELTRDGSENIEIVERTSGNIVFRWTRIGVDDFECRIHCGGVACIIQNDGMKDIAGGIAGLDGLVELPLALIKAALTGKETDLNAVVSSDTYAGNSTANRAIPHGLGRIPDAVLIINTSGVFFTIIDGRNTVSYTHGTGNGQYTVTAPDSTNFYVGNSSEYSLSANGTGGTYFWVAIG